MKKPRPLYQSERGKDNRMEAFSPTSQTVASPHDEIRREAPPAPSGATLKRLLNDHDAGRPVDIDLLVRCARACWDALCRRVAEDENIRRENQLVWRVGLSDRAQVTREREALESAFAAVRDLGTFLLKVAERGAA